MLARGAIRRAIINNNSGLLCWQRLGLFAAARAIELMYQNLRVDGTTTGETHRLMTFSEFNELIGVEQKYSLAKRFGAI